MARQVAAAAGKTGEEDLLLALDADTAAYFGHLGKARELSRRAADSAELAAGKETATTYYATSALREALIGNADRAGQQAILAKGRESGRDVNYGFAPGTAFAGKEGPGSTFRGGVGKRIADGHAVP